MRNNLSVSICFGLIAGLVALLIIQSEFSLGPLITASALLSLSILLIRRYEFSIHASEEKIAQLEAQIDEMKRCCQNLSEQKKVFTENMTHLDNDSKQYFYSIQQFITSLKNERANYRKACEALQRSQDNLLSEVKGYGR